jgi:hypothetical protein
MRRRFIAVLVLSNILAASGASAADGFKATAVASRLAPADIVQVSFTAREQLGGGSNSEGKDGLEGKDRLEAKDRGAQIAAELAKRGLRIVRRGFVIMGKGYDSKYDGGVVSQLLGRDKPAGKDAPVVQRSHVFLIAGFKHPDEVIVHLSQLGVRVSAPWILQSSEAERIAEELSLEAGAQAVAKARRLAAHLGVTAGQVVDVATSHGRGETVAASHPGYQHNALDVGPDGLPRVVIAVSATATLAPQR